MCSLPSFSGRAKTDRMMMVRRRRHIDLYMSGSSVGALSPPMEEEGDGVEFDAPLATKLTAGVLLGVLCLWGFLVAGTRAVNTLTPTVGQDGLRKGLHSAVFGFACFFDILFFPLQRREAKDKNFIKNLRRPTWAPPPLAFPIVWSLIKTLWTVAMSTAFDIVGRNVFATIPTGLFAVHLTLGTAWSNLYTKENQLGAGVPLIFLLGGTFIGTAWALYKISPIAGLLYIPSCIWGCIASCLNVRVWQLNGCPPLYPFRLSGSPGVSARSEGEK
ncbi:unnamed protein product [Choristocarpus tenellus]